MDCIYFLHFECNYNSKRVQKKTIMCSIKLFIRFYKQTKKVVKQQRQIVR